ncbi:unnamed protein product [Tilletia controversa]|nr:unnamed protein product [Tilletia controversa]
MVKSQDIFSPTTTPSLKCLAVAYFPSKGASRMNRPALVELFLQGMADEEAAKTCAVCARRTFSNDLLFTKDDLKCSTVSAERLDLDLLAITDPHVLARPEHHFEYGHPSLKGLALERAGVHIVNEDVQLDVCGDCLSSLTHDPPTLPGLALANGNLRGVLPDDLQDITWLEERLCAKYLASAYVIRLYDLTSPGAAESRPRVMKGHACSFPLNTVSTAVKLPWAFGDGGPILSCIVIGPRKPRREDLRKVFKVRRNKVLSLMKYLRTHFKDYPQIPIDEEALLALSENDVPELIMRHVIYEARGEVPSLFDQETAGLKQHPALIPEDAEDEDPDGGTFLEHHGTIDINAVFHCLLGWDMRKKKPSAQGGILGELAAYFLVKEFTMRGQLHSHCLLWLKGGLNPSTLRAKLRNSDEFRARYLQFFDDLIAHELPPSPTTAAPSTSSEVTPARFPRQERPPHPSDPDYALKFAEDHRLLGEAVQRHRCTFTCFKGGRDSCRFLFPHELNEHPAFDAATNSVYPRIRDGTVNWHNPLLLVATRHNHDLKAVQSGKSGVAAASYITSYATKSDETPANQISMINTVYERMDKTDTDTSDAQALLSRCVMQFGRERQLHAQQAVSYVRDLGDTLQSHKTVPMLSGRLVRTALQLFGPARQDSGDPEPEPAQQDADRPATQDAFAQGEVMLADNAMELDGAELEAEGGPIVEASNGAITHEERESEDAYLLPLNNKRMAHQVEDYLHRGDTLADLTFYDFVRCCKIIKKPRRWNKNHHPLGEDHANVAEHCHRYAPDAPLGIPRAIFSSFPRSNGTDRHGDSYCSSMLAHFIPFSEDRPLKQQHQTWEQVYADALFSTDAQRIMSNWAALTECEDARDDEQLCRRKREAARSFDMDADITLCRDGDEEAGADNPNADVDMELLTQQTRQSKETLSYMSALAKSGWFDSDNRTGPGSSNNEADSPVVSFDAKQRRRWTAEQDILEAQTKADLSIPKATQGILAEQLDFEEGDSARNYRRLNP